MRLTLVAAMTVAFYSCLITASLGAGDWNAIAHANVDYLRDIKPIFTEKCSACHGPLQQQSDLRLDAVKLMLAGGASGPAIVPGNAAESLLIQRITAEEDSRMPPAEEGERLTAEQIELLRSWINAGAVAPADEPVLEDPAQHWAYQRPQRAAVPDSGPTHAIDAFIAAKHAEYDLKPTDAADKRTLLRRVYFDVIGLPPTPAQLEAFLADESPTAWDRVVDELLQSPHYGERWGRHWMDVWRYSDWDGYMQELRGSQRHIWRWRDWIVKSLNDDAGYDRMVLEMLAGDELAPLDESILPATGFLARNYHNSNRNIWLDATVEHTAKAFLGMTLNCARCHDHKFDPIPQTDYYAFRAIFEPHNIRTDRLPGQPDLGKDGLPRAFDAEPGAATYLFFRGDEKQLDEEHPLPPRTPTVLGGEELAEPTPLPVLAYYPALQQHAVAEDLQAATNNVTAAEQALSDARKNQPSEKEPTNEQTIALLELKAKIAQAELASYEARLAADEAKYRPAESSCDPAESERLAEIASKAEGDLNVLRAELVLLERQQALATAEAKEDADANKEAEVNTAMKLIADAETRLQEAQDRLKAEDATYTPLGQEYPRESTGRRLALARTIISPDNPLAARVAVNHIWLRHFGEPLVENVFDFGLRSPRPEYQELLDWLAVELMESGWSMKHVHRLILSSDAWRRSSSADGDLAAHNIAIDPDNKLLWKANVIRLDAEIVRDSVLAVAGSLDESLGGPEIDFTLGEQTPRRSIYLRHAYEKQNRMLVLFDVASPNECYRRSQSIIPQQALALANSSLSLNQSRILAAKLWEEVADQSTKCSPAQAEKAFVEAAFLRMLTRSPSDEERAACLIFLAEQASLLQSGEELGAFSGGAEATVKPADDPQAQARESLIHVLINHNDFLSIR